MRQESEIVAAVEAQLPQLARGVIRAHLDIEEPHNNTFLQHPDQRDQHQTQWHQWGILTHTRVFLGLYETEVPERLRAWGLWDETREWLRQTVDGVERWDLLKISILLHDIGKFGSRTYDRGGFHFAGHEKLSGKIIRQELHLDDLGLTQSQIEYVALTAEDHFVLALTRKRARERGGFTPAFARSREFRDIALAIRDSHPQDFVEIGVLFLGDSMAKADESGPEKAIAQNPSNEALARSYLEIVLERAPI